MSASDATFTGNLTRDPEFETVGAAGTPKLKFSIACEHSWRTKDGEWDSTTSFFNVVAWRALAENARDVLEKGLRVVVKGRLEQRSYEADDGTKRSVIDLIADDIAVSVKGIDGINRRPRREGGANAGSQQQSRRSVPDTAWDDEPF
jgi:single-strand DNA-binding protein